MSFTISDTFVTATGPTSTATVNAYKASRFSSVPTLNTPGPGAPDYGPVTSGLPFGGPGQFQIAVGTNEPYYCSFTYNGQTTWKLYNAASFIDGTQGSIALNGTLDGGINKGINFAAGVSPTDLATVSQIVPGPQGSQGPQGSPSTVPGPQGATGSQGSQGSTGAQGNQGYQGFQGNQGLQGSQGVQGATGSQGAQGSQGTQGVQGFQGFQGANGSQGTQGANGSQGAQGATGSQGATGAQGSQGTQGLQGSQGSQGTQGTQGGGVPTAGTTGQILAKNSATNYDTGWVNPLMPSIGVPAMHNFLAWTNDPAVTSIASSAQVAGVVNYEMIYLQQGQVLSNITVCVQTGGTAVASSYLGLYNASGTQLAVTAAITTTFQAAGAVKTPFVASYTVPTTGFYFVALLIGPGTTTSPKFMGPAVGSGLPSSSNVGIFGPAAGVLAYRYATAGTGVTVLPSPYTGTQTGTNNYVYWAGLN